MIYVNLFVQSNGVVAYSKLLGIGNDIYEIFFFPPLKMNTMEKIRDSRKGKRNPCSTRHLGAEEAETAGQVRGCGDSPETQFRVFPCGRLIIWGICGPRKECVRFLEG